MAEQDSITRFIKFECLFNSSITEHKGLPIRNVCRCRRYHGDASTLTIIGIEIIIQSDQKSCFTGEIGTTPDFQLILTGISGGKPSERSSTGRLEHCFTPFGKTDDDIVKTQACFCSTRTIGRVLNVQLDVGMTSKILQ